MNPSLLLQYHVDSWITAQSSYAGLGDTSSTYGSNGSGGLASGTGGPATITYTRNSGVSKGRFGAYQFLGLDPHLFLDTRFTPFPYTLRIEIVGRVEHIADTAEVIYGIGTWKDDVDITASLTLIGFRCRNGGNWRATVKDEATVWLDADTGVAAVGSYRALRVDIEGQTRTVRFFIDGAQVASYTFAAPNTLGAFGTGFDLPPVGPAVWNEIGPTGGSRLVVVPGYRPAVTLLTPEAEIIGAGPDKPTLSVTAVGPNYVDLAGSPYVHAQGLGQRLSIWQVDEVGGDFSSPVRELVEGAVAAARITGLTPLTTYIARVAYFDSLYTASPWSDAVAFSTDIAGAGEVGAAGRFTYQQVLNMARQRHPRLPRLVLDDDVVVVDINQLVLDLLDEMGRADIAITQQLITYSADIQPGLDGSPALTAITDVELPDWITKVLAVEAVYGAAGQRREVDVRRLETKIRDRARDEPEVDDENMGLRPIAYLVWQDGAFVLRKWSEAATMWSGITELELVVEGRKTPATEQDLTSTVPLPERALLACAERYAVLLGQRVDLGETWIEDQERVAQQAVDRLVEWAGDFLMKDEPMDPDVR